MHLTTFNWRFEVAEATQDVFLVIWCDLNIYFFLFECFGRGDKFWITLCQINNWRSLEFWQHQILHSKMKTIEIKSLRILNFHTYVRKMRDFIHVLFIFSRKERKLRVVYNFHAIRSERKKEKLSMQAISSYHLNLKIVTVCYKRSSRSQQDFSRLPDFVSSEME